MLRIFIFCILMAILKKKELFIIIIIIDTFSIPVFKYVHAYLIKVQTILRQDTCPKALSFKLNKYNQKRTCITTLFDKIGRFNRNSHFLLTIDVLSTPDIFDSFYTYPHISDLNYLFSSKTGLT